MTLAKMVEEDCLFSTTPDLPKLRYMSDMFVFLWDKESYPAEAMKLVDPSSMSLEFMQAVTDQPYYSVHDKKQGSKSYGDYVFYDRKGLDNSDVKLYNNLEAKRVIGRIYKCNYHAILDLDDFYNNNFTFIRREVNVHSSVYCSTPRKCWMYFSDPSACFKYDFHEKKYVSLKHLTLTDGLSDKINGEEFTKVRSLFIP